MYRPDIILESHQTLWMTSDTHFGHTNIIKYCNRPYRDPEEMNQDLLAKWNSVVKPEDHVIHLGDVAMGQLDKSLSLVKHLNGHKILILGNHDRPYQGWYRGEKRIKGFQTYKDAGFDEIYDEAFLHYGVWSFYLNHIPYTGDLGANEDRTSYEKNKLIVPEDQGVPLICGHVHDAWLTAQSSKGTRMVNVGVDVHGFSPVSIHKVLELHQ